MTDSDVVLYDVDKGVAQVTLNRPEALNAWVPELGRAYFDRLEEADADPDVRAIIVTGAGRGFCAGVDFAHLREIYEGQGVRADQEVVAYCRIGERSSHTWFALTELLGYPTVKNYDGSWTEYGSLVGVPVEKG